MREPQPKAIQLKDYSPPEFRIDSVDLDVDLRDDHARVRAKLQVRRNGGPGPLVLDGEELQLISVSLDGKQPQYEVAAQKLTLRDVPDAFTLETVSRIVPQKNTQLEGLYATKNGFVTQCEAEGFRRITWFIDRPDVMARYTTTVHAERKRYPVLLSNGNLTATGEDPGGRHWARFVDPFPKPSYLFAMVAADLEVLEDAYQGKKLFVYVEPGKLDQAGWAMDCLKRAIQWDEKRFGLRLDLDQYKIVAVGDFNSGAMENKGLNIFNTKYMLARSDVATDTDYLSIDRVVAHEYFHNWTGNRVTCRDWFQLSLKEGLTVFRPGVRRRHLLARRDEDPGSARAAGGPVPGGRRPDEAPGAAAVVHGDPQLLHHDGVRERRRTRAHAAQPARRGEIPGRDAPVLQAARRPGGHLRRLRAGDAGRLRHRPVAVQALVRRRRHAGARLQGCL